MSTPQFQSLQNKDRHVFLLYYHEGLVLANDTQDMAWRDVQLPFQLCRRAILLRKLF